MRKIVPLLNETIEPVRGSPPPSAWGTTGRGRGSIRSTLCAYANNQIVRARCAAGYLKQPRSRDANCNRTDQVVSSFSHSYCRLVNLTIMLDCFQNQAACVSQCGLVDAHSRSKWRRIWGTNFPISMSEMFLPIHVRAPPPNCKRRLQRCFLISDENP